MKKQLFSFVMMIALVIVAGSVFGQDPITPFRSSAYTYTVGGIDAGTVTRKARIYYTTAAAPSTKITIGGANSISIGTTITNPGAIANATGVQATDSWDITLPVGATSVTFDATYGATVGLVASRIWIEIYNNAAGNSCFNTMFLTVTPAVNTLDYSIVADAGLTICTATTTPTSQQTDAVDASTVFTYTVTRVGGTPNYNWSFDLSLNDNQSLTEGIVVNAGGVITPVGSVYTIPGASNLATITVTVTNVAGTDNANYVGTISSMTQYVGATTTVNSTADLNGPNNTDTIILLEVPSIGTFTGN